MSAENVAVVERFLSLFDRRWPTEEELRELLAPDVRFVERPNRMNPHGGERDAAASFAGIERGRELLTWQSYEIRDHVASGDVVVARFRWRGEAAGKELSAWCVGHYRLREGRIVEIEQHDCYDPM